MFVNFDFAVDGEPIHTSDPLVVSASNNVRVRLVEKASIGRVWLVLERNEVKSREPLTSCNTVFEVSEGDSVSVEARHHSRSVKGIIEEVAK